MSIHRARGFTLIELMIAVVVVAIISAIAYPSYTSYIMRGQRSSAQQLMADIANKQQQHLLDAKQYTQTLDSGGLNISADGWTCSGTSCTNTRYTVTVDQMSNTATPPTFRIKAVPTTAQASDGYLYYNQSGQKIRSLTDGGADIGW